LGEFDKVHRSLNIVTIIPVSGSTLCWTNPQGRGMVHATLTG
jgi:hypothetical protein